MNKATLILRLHFLEIVGLVVVCVITWMFATSARGEHLTQQFFDGIRETEQREEVVIVGIDDKSLQTLGAWPWNRKIFAELTKKLDGYRVKAIVYDVLFLESREGDDLFKDVLSRVQNDVVLASKIENSNYLSSFLINSSNTKVISALSNVNPDVDGKVREYPLSNKQNGVCVYGLGEKAFRLVTFKIDSLCEEKNHLNFRYPTTITKYSLVDVISDKIEPKKLQGKVVFIGSTSLDLEDHFVGMSGEKISGVQVHASVFASLLNKEGDRILSGTEIALMIIFFIVLTLLLLYFAKTILGQTSVFLLMIVSVVLVSYTFFSNHIIIPAPWLILTVLLSGGYSTLIRFIKERKESKYVQSLFSKYVHKDVLSELMKHPKSLNLTGEKRDLTVLFSDLRGFTTLSESLSPEELTKVLNGYFSAMTPSILDEKGTIDKFIGDAIMAFWNAPLPVEHHELHAVNSALRMQEDLIKFNQKNKTALAVGIGIHSGSAVVGNVGSMERVNYTVLGDTVNLASRVESLTKKYGVGILVTEEVKNKVNDKNILFRKLDIITVKGKSEATVLYEVMRTNKDKLDLVKDYEIAFEVYQRGDFEKAKILFITLAENGDIPSQKMCERILTLKEDKNWDGIWHFDEK